MGTVRKACYAGPMKILQYSLCAFLTFTSLAQGAKIKAPKFSLDKLQSTYSKSPSLEADIVQEVYQASLARTKTSKGSILLSKPNFVRWEMTEPEATLLVSNGRKVFYFTPNARGPGKGQVIEKKATTLSKQPLFRLLTGAGSWKQDFTLQSQKSLSLDGSPAGHEIILEPKTKELDLKKVTLKVSRASRIEEILLENPNGNRTRIILQNQTLGAKLPTNLFDFKPPADTETIRQ